MTLASTSFASSHRHVIGALCAALVASLAGSSRADESAENTAAARALGIEGVQLADAGKCPEAIEKLTRAEALHHAPTILGRLGECQVNVGQVVEGTENLNSVVREQLAPNAPKVFHDAQERAQKVLTAATPKIAHLVVRITPAEVNASVLVAGKPVPAALIGAERPTDPGTLEVTATAPGYKPASASVTLAEGGHQDITLLMEKDPNAVVAPALGTPPAVVATQAPPAPAAHHSNAPAYVALGIGAVGVLAGSVTGALAFSKASDCPDKVCPTQDKLDSAKSMATISTVTFGVGIAGIAVGTILLLTNHSSEAAPAQAQAQAKPRPEPKLTVHPWIGVSSLGVMGSFQ